MWLGSTQPLKHEYQDTPGGKDGRCVRLTTYHIQVPMSRNLEASTSQNPLSHIGLQWEYFTLYVFKTGCEPRPDRIVLLSKIEFSWVRTFIQLRILQEIC
jgi:hypothetical protein